MAASVLRADQQVNDNTKSRYPPRNEPGYNIPSEFINLNEVTGSNTERTQIDGPYPNQQHEGTLGNSNRASAPVQPTETSEGNAPQVSKAATQLYTIAHLIFFSLFGTLARLGLSALTKYPGAPVIFTILWSNVGGSLIMGFLIEDRMLFRHEWGRLPEMRLKKSDDAETGSDTPQSQLDLAAAKKAHLAVKKTIPMYVGLATGFCGSFTSFSSFIRDAFLAISNNLLEPSQTSTQHRNGGYSFMAMLAVVITTVALSLSALIVGGHLANAVERATPSIPFRLTRKVIDPTVVVLGFGCWLGAVFLAIFPPHTSWRGQVIFSLVFAPLGCLARFYLALYLNGRFPSFPLGTFAANILGTAVLGMAWDIAHAPIGGLVGCQVLQGIEDGFCGCLTTVSTWVSELNSLKRRSSWIYGSVSVIVALVILIAIMGGLRWSDGFDGLVCRV